jgi:hypothetical protein
MDSRLRGNENDETLQSHSQLEITASGFFRVA